MKTGGTDGVVASSGAMGTDGTHQFKYRGIEDPWGHMYQFVDGVNINDNQAWVCKDARGYSSDKFAAPYEKLSYVNLDRSAWIGEMGYDPKHPYAQFPTVAGTGLSTRYADYYTSGSGQTIARFGGFWTLTGAAGLSLWYMGSKSTETSLFFGGRLVRKPI